MLSIQDNTRGETTHNFIINILYKSIISMYSVYLYAFSSLNTFIFLFCFLLLNDLYCLGILIT
jgi:hypothetical protein